MSTTGEGGSRNLAFTYRGDEVRITYNPQRARHQLEFLRVHLPTVSDVLEQDNALISALLPMLVSWNVEENGQPLPITDASLRRTPLIILLRLVNEVANDLGEQFQVRLEVR
jgi:hypothetical protein